MDIGKQIHLKRSIHEIAALLPSCVILDTETTRMYGEVIDLAVIDGATGSILFDSIIHPTTELITKEATRIHGITAHDTWDKPTFELVWPRIEAAIGDKWIVTYNAKFDQERIVQSARYNQKPLPQLTWLCAMEAYASYWGEPGRYGSCKWQKLENACKQQGVVLNGAHRALADAMATYQLIKAVAAKSATPAVSPREQLGTTKGIELIDAEKGHVEL